MTSYVYNPSKKVTELLSQYLEFDPEQLQLGIWSGNLTLSNVNLRQEAIAPLLNRHLNPNSPTNTTDPSAKTPLKFNLVSGKIGSLSMKIPWKSLVWGQGDVQVDLRNIVISLALEADETTKKDRYGDPEQFQPKETSFPRDKKQKILQAAEKRLVQHRLLGPWLQGVRKKEEEEQAKKGETVAPTDGALVKWLRSISSDFFWRFCVGLQMNVENVKVILVQEGVEIGLLLPLSKVIPGKPTVEARRQAVATPEANNEADSVGSSSTQQDTTQQGIEDGGQVDKQLRVVGIGLYVRSVGVDVDHNVPADIYTSDYVMRPVDVNFDFSLFFPVSPEKRKKKALKPEDEIATDAAIPPQSTGSSTKQRRGKREKEWDVATDETARTTRVSGDEVTSPNTDESPISPFGAASPKRLRRLHRRLSVASTPLDVRHSRPDRAPAGPALPLAQPDDIGATYTSRTRSFSRNTQSARFDGNLKVGAIEVVCSATHYRLVNHFLASSARMRNGRPKSTIHSSIRHFHESVTSMDHEDSSTPAECSTPENSSSRNSYTIITKPDVVRMWWRYVFEAVDWEIRQRRRLRRLFQQKYLTFNWDAQHYKRKEYVNLFILVCLDKQNSNQDRTTSTQKPLLLKLEDELHVEQILLYRSIARSVHVLGGKKMPSSILRLKYGDEAGMRKVMHKVATGKNEGSGPVVFSEETPGFVGALGARCEVARERLRTPIGGDMPCFDRVDAKLDLRESETEEGSYDLDNSEARTVRTNRSTKSQGFSVAATAIDSANIHEFDTGMIYAFAITVQRLELMIVADENRTNGYGPVSVSGVEKNDPFSSDALSILTDDHRFGPVEESSIAVEESETSERIFPSSDFLLFKMPENIILRANVSNLTCLSLGRTGGSRNVNCSVGRVDVSGEDGFSLFGAGLSHRETPLEEIKLTTPLFGTFARKSSVPRNALALSVIGRAQTHFVQCDAPRITAALHMKTLKNVFGFIEETGATFPRKILPRSPREELRLYILHQNQMLFTGLNCSIRIHGCHITLPASQDEIGFGDMKYPRGEALNVRCEMIEIYSGGAVEDLSASMQNRNEDQGNIAMTTSVPNNKTETTRRLGMLDVPGILLSNDSLLCTHWVFTTSGIDVNLSLRKHATLKLFQLPVEVEALYSLNGDSLLDSNRARHEVVVEVSPLHACLTPSHFDVLSTFSQALEDIKILTSREVLGPQLPRLEVLSKFMRFSADISIRHCRIFLDHTDDHENTWIPNDKRIETTLSLFLHVVSKYDLSFPHEEALAVAMQMCIDRLVGIGLHYEEAWEVSNLAMLRFLEDIADSKASEGSSDYDSDSTSGSDIRGVSGINSVVRRIAQQTVSACKERIDELPRSISDEYSTLIIDFPNGVSLTTVSLFYDSNISLGVPSLVLAGSNGVQYLRVSASEVTDDECSSTEKAEKQDAEVEGSAGFGISLQLFLVDEKAELGKDGLPLTALGGDAVDSTDGLCSFEKLCDIEFGDVELFVSGSSCRDLMSIEEQFSKYMKPSKQPSLSKSSHDTPSDQELSFIGTFKSVSVVFSCEGFLPFSRVVLTKAKAKIKNNRRKVEIASTDIEIMNLLPQGDLHPTILSTVARTDSCCFEASFGFDDGMSIILRSVRFIFLRQFLSEATQYFLSESYELGAALSQRPRSEKKSKPTVCVEILESSFILPQSSSSYEMMCIKAEKVRVRTSFQNGSFVMPGPGSPFMCQAGGKDIVHRLTIGIRDARLFAFTGFPSQEVNSSSFRYFYELNGRADLGKRVFRRRLESFTNITDVNPVEETAMADSLWAESTNGIFSLDVMVDHAPHLRLLITDPIYEPHTGLHLDFSLQQFCLLLSFWYVNMQELPVMLPYSAEQILTWSAQAFSPRYFPEYGTSDFERDIGHPGKFSTEILFVLESLSFRCEKGDGTLAGSPEYALRLSFRGAVVRVSVDEFGTTRIGSGSSGVKFVDELSDTGHVLRLGDASANDPTWADHLFGLDCTHEKVMEGGLPQQFQLSIWMTPSWTIYNLGLQSPELHLSSLKPIFDFLSFVSAYFTEKQNGNPIFESLAQAEDWRDEIVKSSPRKSTSRAGIGSGIDFRLWALAPSLNIPCLQQNASPQVCLRGEGLLWYKFMALRGWQSQECVVKGLDIVFDNKLGVRGCPSLNEDSFTLVENFSMGLQIDHRESENHKNVCLQMPFTDEAFGGIFNTRIVVKPPMTTRPTICTPAPPFADRRLGLSVCEITCISDVVPLVSDTLLAFFGVAGEDADSVTEEMDSVAVNPETATFSYAISLGSFRVFVLDPVLRRHLPLAVVTISSLSLAASKFSNDESKAASSVVMDKTPSDDLQISFQATCWIDCFKLGLTRSWEPFLERCTLSGMHERSKSRGSGLSFMSGNKMQLNLSSALLGTVSNVVGILDRLVNVKPGSFQRSTATSADAGHSRLALTESVGDWEIGHEIPAPPGDNCRVPFSICNMTGGKIRVSQPLLRSEKKVPLVYMDHQDTAKLEFLPTVTSVENLLPVEVSYPGFKQNSPGVETLPPHTLDIQLEGFRWIRMISFDSIGRQFAPLVPKLSVVQEKTENDWQLKNVMNVLVETGLQGGGRQVTVRSVFKIVNNTSRDLDLLLSPQNNSPEITAGPQHEEEHDVVSPQRIIPGGSYYVPFLLFESALQFRGTCLGYASLRPSLDSLEVAALKRILSDSPDFRGKLDVGYSSKPLSFMDVVCESADILRDGAEQGEETGLQSACPVWTNFGSRLASFFFQVEVGRNPILDGVRTELPRPQLPKHGPLLYTLTINPPFTISNLLPKAGRFTLKHATREIVVWYADLDPGEEAPVHTVGLDAPLLLFIDLGFAKTPVGEGALVHHGAVTSDSTRGNIVGLKSIGKAGKAMTKQLGRTFTSMAESPNQLERVKSTGSQRKEKPDKFSSNFMSGSSDDFDGKLYNIEKLHFLAEEIEKETVIVDGLGQMLTLNIENVRGGGGQRKITLFCNFWLVNTTEHCLRYKQENFKQFVAGTVHSPTQDGSKVIRPGDDRADTSSNPLWQMCGSSFAGTPGALASFPGRCTLQPQAVSSALDKNMSFQSFAKTAFMFSFFEGPVIGMGQQKMCVQLGDGTGKTNYVSDWSRGFSLDSVGITQAVGVHCKDGRMLEINVVVHAAPGALSNRTKIVRFLPRFVVVNNLSTPIRIWQDNSLFRPIHEGDSLGDGMQSNWSSFRARSKQGSAKVSQYERLWGRRGEFDTAEDWETLREESAARKSAIFIAILAPGDVVPFCLPDSRRDRQLRVDLGRPWDLSASISADMPGDHTLRISQATELQNLPHVLTRASPQFEVKLTENSVFDGDLGIWFETEVDSSQQIIVKAIKTGSYSFNCTDVHVGDELLAIDGVPVSIMPFNDTMALLKERLANISSLRRERKNDTEARESMSLHLNNWSDGAIETGNNENDQKALIITFRSVEERLRLVRRKAAKSHGYARKERSITSPDVSYSGHSESRNFTGVEHLYLRVELKTHERSDVGMFVVVDEETSVPFRIRNQSIGTTICFRQKGCNHHRWSFLKPGRSTSYTWEEPLKAKRLSVRISLNHDSAKPEATTETYRTLKDEEEGVFTCPVSVRLEEIGFEEFLSVPHPKSKKGYLKLTVDVDESSRVLVVTDGSTSDGNNVDLNEHLGALTSEISLERGRLEALRSLTEDCDSSHKAETTVKSKIADVAQDLSGDPISRCSIYGCHQLIVTVQEAMGLNPGSLAGTCNPFVDVRLKGCDKRRKRFLKTRDKRNTVYVKNTHNPVWRDQQFVFNVSRDTINNTRGCAVQVQVKSFRVLGRHTALGRTQIDLHCLRDQAAKEGWFPLSGRSGRQELENDHSHWGRGSIKLRLQWIYSPGALLQYFILLSEQKLFDFSERKLGIENQLKALELQQEHEKDSLKPLRFQELFSLSKSNMKARAAEMNRRRKPPQNVVTKLIEPLRPSDKSGKQSSSDDTSSNLRVDSISLLSNSWRLSDSASPDRAARKRMNSSSGILQGLEDQISETRQAIQRFNPVRPRFGSFQKVESDNIEVPPSTFKSWTLLQAILSRDLELAVVGGNVKIQLGRHERDTLLHEHDEKGAAISRCLSAPLGSPSCLAKLSTEVASGFVEARRSFDRAATMRLRTILNPGGWLTIRPITALNLTDGYTKLFVRVEYGSEVLTTGNTNDLVNPEWSPLSSGDSRNDIHIHVAPQKTSGSIRVSIVGEKRNQQLHSNTELGVVFLPLGRAIAACVSETNETRSESFEYVRWFPLKCPKDMVHSEGDAGLSTNPSETEKVEYHMLENSFAPCLKMALVWLPESEDGTDIAHAKPRSIASFKIPSIQSYFTADFSNISLVLIDSAKAKELLSLTILAFDLYYWATKAKTRLGLSAGWVQIDYQDEDTREPVVVAPTQCDQLVPVVQALAVKDNSRSVRGVSALDFIDISLAEFDVTVEENLLFDLVSLIASACNGFGTDALFNQDTKTADATFYSILTDKSRRTKHEGTKLYIRQLFLGILRINLSYVKGRRYQGGWHGSDHFLAGRDTRDDSDVLRPWMYGEDNLQGGNDKQGRVMPSYVTNLLPNVSDAPIRLPGKALSHVFQSPVEILKSIRRFYITEVVKQLYKILGSLDFVGNPTMLVTSFFSGFRDMVVAPSVALLNSPTDPSKAGLIFAQGTLSMVSYSTSGFFGTLARVSASAGQGVAAMSLDAEFREWHRNVVLADATNIKKDWKKRGVRNLGLMVARPISDIVIGVTGGVSGVITSPIRGYRKTGNRGLAEGVVIGITGLLAKPLVGFLDSFSHCAGAIHDIAKSVNVLDKRIQPAQRLRLPYAFGIMSILAPYNEQTARAQKLLRRFPLHAKESPDTSIREAIIHVEILSSTETETFIIATACRVVVARVTWDATGTYTANLCWEGIFSDADSDSQTVFSMIDEHDLSLGSSLTLVKRSKCNNAAPMSRTVSDTTKHLANTIRAVGFSTPITRLASSQHTEEEHIKGGTSTSSDDHFTVFGEYRFRSQMIKMHNAICCISGNFEKLVYDPCTDHQSGSEGYRVFGPFSFRDTSMEEPSEDFVAQDDLEEIPWITKQFLLECQNKTPSEQKLHVNDRREAWTIDDEIDLSRIEGGPEWFIKIRAESRFVESKRWSPRTLQPIKKFCWDESEDAVAPTENPEKTSPIPLPPDSLHRYFSAATSGSQNHWNGSDHNHQGSVLKPLESRERLTLEPHSPPLRGFDAYGRRHLSSDRIFSSFATAQAETTIDELPSPTVASLPPNAASNSRLDRMENILEQLLMFTAQQTNDRKHEASLALDVTNLQDQVDVLRSELHRDELQAEIAALRDQVTNLQRQLGSSEENKTTPADADSL